MASDWEIGRLKDIADVVMGQSPSAEFVNEIYQGLPLLNGPTEFGSMYPSPVQFTTDARKKAMVGDLLFCVRGSTTGRMNWADQEYAIGRGLAAIRHQNGNSFQHFLRAVIELKLPDLLAAATGSTFPNVGRDQLLDIPVSIPTKDEQKTISSFFKCLDDKIEINRRINQTLEAMAQAIFKSWFVDFDPVKAKITAIEQGEDPLRAAMCAISGKTDAELDQMPREHHNQLAATAALFPDEMEESDLGGIPKGWAFQAADLLTEVGIGKTPPRKEPQWFTEGEGDWRWVSIRDMGVSGVFQQRSSEFLTSEAVSRFNVRVVPDRTVLLSFKLTIGRVALTDGPMVTNEAIAHFKLPTDAAISSEYLYLYLKSFDYSMLGSTSSIADAVNSKTIREMPIVVASRSLIDRFTRSVAPLFMEMKNRQNEITSLCATRDALLPKMLSGEIEVSP